MNIEVNGTTLPVDPRFVPVCTLDPATGKPVPLSGSGGGGLPAGAATEAKQTDRIDQAAGYHLDLMAGRGSDFIADTDAHAGSYLGLIVIADAVIDAITLGGGSTGGAALVGLPLTAGQQILTPFTSITLAEGVVQLVKAS